MKQINNPDINRFFDEAGFQRAYKAEVLAQSYGNATLKLVNFLQEFFLVPEFDMGVVDPPTADMFNRFLDQFNGLRIEKPEGYPYENSVEDKVSEPKESGQDEFSASGRVFDKKGAPVKYQAVSAFDVDLRGAAVYRTLLSINEIVAKGFEFLEQGSSDEKGDYSVSFSRSQFEKTERKKADVIVYAVDKEGMIIGRSRLVTSGDYSEEGEVKNLDVFVTKEDERTEYQLLMGKLLPFLEESQVRLIELAASNDQVIFAAGELDESESKIQVAVDAESLKAEPIKRAGEQHRSENLAHELLYGIGRQNIPLSWPVLYNKTDSELKAAMEKSVKEKIIGLHSENDIALFLETVHEYAAAYILGYKGANQAVSLEKMLSVALPEKEQQASFVRAYRSFNNQVPANEAVDYKKFWNKYLPGETEFREKPELISGLLLTQQLTVLSANHQPLIEELQVNRRISSVTQLIGLENKEWKKIIAKTGVPEFINRRRRRKDRCLCKPA